MTLWFLERSRHSVIGTKLLNETIEVFDSDFGLIPWEPQKVRASIMDGRWVLLKHGITSTAIMSWWTAAPEDRPAWRSLLRAVAPGFMNRGHRRAIYAAFIRELTAIYNRGSIPVLEIDLDTARRISDFRTSG